MRKSNISLLFSIQTFTDAHAAAVMVPQASFIWICHSTPPGDTFQCPSRDVSWGRGHLVVSQTLLGCLGCELEAIILLEGEPSAQCEHRSSLDHLWPVSLSQLLSASNRLPLTSRSERPHDDQKWIKFLKFWFISLSFVGSSRMWFFKVKPYYLCFIVVFMLGDRLIGSRSREIFSRVRPCKRCWIANHNFFEP